MLSAEVGNGLIAVDSDADSWLAEPDGSLRVCSLDCRSGSLRRTGRRITTALHTGRSGSRAPSILVVLEMERRLHTKMVAAAGMEDIGWAMQSWTPDGRQLALSVEADQPGDKSSNS
jgi:hypothetical protein